MTRRSDDDNDEEETASPAHLQKKLKGEKHVSFPPDEEIVSGFAERKDTPRNGEPSSASLLQPTLFLTIMIMNESFFCWILMERCWIDSKS